MRIRVCVLEWLSGKVDSDLDDTVGKAEFVPCVDHSAAILSLCSLICTKKVREFMFSVTISAAALTSSFW